MSRFHLLIITALGVTWILDGLEVTIVGAIGPVLQDSRTLGLSTEQIGLAGSTYVIGAVMEGAHQEDGDSCHRLSVRFRADVGGNRHFTDVELVAAHHASERSNEWFDLFKVEGLFSLVSPGVI